jgi:WD40 repeat protein
MKVTIIFYDAVLTHLMKRALLPGLFFAAVLLNLTSFVHAQDFMPEKFKILSFDGFVSNFRFSANVNYAGVTTGDNAIHLLDGKFDEIWAYKGIDENYAGSVAFTPDEKFMIFTKYQSNSDIALFSIAEKKVVQYLKSQLYYITDLTISPDGKLIASCGDDRALKVYVIENKRLKLFCSLSVDCPDFQFINCVRFSPNGKYLAAAGTGTDIFYFSVSDTLILPLQTQKFRLWTSALTFSPDSKYLLSATSDSIYVWGFKNGKFDFVNAFSCWGGETTCLKFDATGKFLLASKENAVIKVFLWNNGYLEPYNELELHRDCVFDIDFSQDGLFMTSSSRDNTALIWKLGDIAEWEKRMGENISKGVVINSVPDTTVKENAVQGKNFLLVIGINNYNYWPKLNNAVKDAQNVRDVLTSRYGFLPENTIGIFNEEASSKNILDQLLKIQETLGVNDNLLIYFSGHGFYNSKIDEGYWVPFDAQKNEETGYLPNSTLVKYIKAINCKHIFLVVDACFSGSLFSDGHKGYVDKVGQFKSRWCLSSGRLELVSDGKTGENSPFAFYFIKFLKENTKPEFSVSELIQYVKVAVSNNTEQTPIGNPLKNVGDEGGEFIFKLKEK